MRVLRLCSASCLVLFALFAAPAFAALATYDATLPNPDPTAQSWTKAPPSVFLPPLSPSYPPEAGSFNAFSPSPAAWEIFDVQDNGNNADGRKSNSEYYYKSVGDQSTVDWVLSFTTSIHDGSYQDFVSQKTAQTNAFQYQAYKGLNGGGNPIFDLWRVELAVVNNGNGTFDLSALGRESFSGSPTANPGPSAVLLDNVSQSAAEGFYNYELRFSVATQEASLWFDSGSGFTQSISGIALTSTTGVPAAVSSAGSNVVAWGNVSDLAGADLLVSSVNFVAVPEASALFCMSVAMVSALIVRFRRRG